jgi:rhamnulose-1-phosphate aldolase/alcohol dehydrogenase
MKEYKYVSNFWDDQKAEAMDELALLLYRSNLLGSDPRIVNTAGGNTSAKIMSRDPLDEREVEVLWVKGSGGDLRTATVANFASLYMSKLLALRSRYRGRAFEDEMVGYYPLCCFNNNPCPPSIDTPLHSFIPHRHVDHTHPDAIIAIAAADNGQAVANEIFGGEMIWVDWQRPGFDLGVKLQHLCADYPQARGIILGNHGLITWGESSRECYFNTLDVIERAAEYLDRKVAARGALLFGGAKHESWPAEKRREVAAQVLPVVRGAVGRENKQVAHFDDAPAILTFVNSNDAPPLARLGTSCPDHFIRTKIRPLLVAFDPATGDVEHLKRAIHAGLDKYRSEYAEYYNAHKRPDSPAMRDTNPTVVLVPGLGMFTFGRDKRTAEVTCEFYNRAVEVMKGATVVGNYTALPMQEAFDIEYWLLEEAKLKRLPPEKELSRQIAFITGAASGIGRAIAEKFAANGAHVVIADINLEGARAVAADLARQFGPGVALAVHADVRDEANVQAAFRETILQFGGVDVVVSNAGLAIARSIEESTVDDFDKISGVLERGYFLVVREAVKVMKAQATGGSIIFIASKNAVASGKNAALYSAAKAFELALMRNLAVEVGEHGIRLNAVNPDAVLQGSAIWDQGWREERARSYGIAPEQLDAYYRDRTILKVSVLPLDVAEAALFLASPRSAKTTAAVIPVDGGVAAGFLR